MAAYEFRPKNKNIRHDNRVASVVFQRLFRVAFATIILLFYFYMFGKKLVDNLYFDTLSVNATLQFIVKN